jgi:hypothetical protein
VWLFISLSGLPLQQVKELLSGPCEKCCSSLLADDMSVFLSLVLTLVGLKVGGGRVMSA